ncbi:hypothetical protein BVRB_7g168670 [Beta vulgaris subsp. vulgaris]|nr:hypothetical protein BVRB_7g168670 [Beta vulgaris subsp. vulgaris]
MKSEKSREDQLPKYNQTIPNNTTIIGALVFTHQTFH